MPNYFANNNRFRPPKREKDLPILNSITGTLESWDIRPGNNESGSWFVFGIKKEDDHINAFFRPDFVDARDLDRIASLVGKTVTIRSYNDKPIVDIIDIEPEESIRAKLLNGVAVGTIKEEDLPALLEFARGKCDQFEKWKVFKQQIDNDGLVKVREDLEQQTAQAQLAITRESDNLSRLNEIYLTVSQEKEKVLRALNSDLLFLQGEDGLEGTGGASYRGLTSDNLVRIENGYRNLMMAIEKIKTSKGVYVLCDGKLHLIHHAYLEEKGRAFLIGTSKEYLRAKPDELKKLVDRIIQTLYGKVDYRSPQ